MIRPELGQVVKLIDSRRKMVVAFARGYGSALSPRFALLHFPGEIGCQWFDRNLELRVELFRTASLAAVAVPRRPPHIFEVGELVRLKSGGPGMTATFVAGDDSSWTGAIAPSATRVT